MLRDSNLPAEFTFKSILLLGDQCPMIGYVDVTAHRWNGFAQPWFTREMIEANADKLRDIFHIHVEFHGSTLVAYDNHPDNEWEPEDVAGPSKFLEGTDTRVYPIGHWGYAWSDVNGDLSENPWEIRIGDDAGTVTNIDEHGNITWTDELSLNEWTTTLEEFFKLEPQFNGIDY